MLSHSCLIEDSSCSAVLGLLCCVLGSWCSTDFQFELQAGQSSTPGSSIKKPCCGHRIPEEGVVRMGADVALKPVYTFQHWWSISRCAGFKFHRHKYPPIPSEMQALNWELITNRGSLSSLVWRMERSWFPKRISDFELWSREDGILFTYGFFSGW